MGLTEARARTLAIKLASIIMLVITQTQLSAIDAPLTGAQQHSFAC